MRIRYLAALAVATAAIARSPELVWERHFLDGGIAEGVAVADFNKDGRLDIFSGDSWYENPTWKKHTVRSLDEYGTYLSSLNDIALDVDGDGYTDIISSGWHNKRIWWSRNPGKPDVPWEDKTIDEGFNVEFAFLVDIDNDGKAREILPQFGTRNASTAWYEFRDGRWDKHVVSDRHSDHGIGSGDVNGDGRNDIILPTGWLEAPPDPRQGSWAFHPEFNLGKTSFIYVLDVNGDGLADLVTGLGHDYGLFWMEQKKDHTWVKHMIDDSWSQPHAITMIDINGDLRPEFVTGKRFNAHDGHDPGEREPLGIYWYEYRKQGNDVQWSKHVVDYGGRAGGGMQIPVVDIDNDGDLDVVVAGKSGLFLFENLTKSARRTQ